MTGIGEILENTRRAAPLVHCVTNYVTANDCANILLACGARPVMADAPEEVEEITSRAAALTLNLGTPNRERVRAMRLAGKQANALGHPVVLDPVGVGASRFRAEAARELLDDVRFAVIRGNAAEIAFLAGDAAALARDTGAVVVMTGADDRVTDGTRLCNVRNGHPLMARVTGTGCMLSALTAAFLAANPGKYFEAAVAAAAAMGLCGEVAAARLGARDGNAALRGYLLDAVFRLTAEELEAGARCELG